MVLGDLNLRDAELGDWNRGGRGLGVREAAYEGFSWNPRMNRYDADEERLEAKPMRFDRVLVAGACAGCAYLVGRWRQYQLGRGFCLSDHFGVMALLDVHSEHGRRDCSVSVVKQRRAALASLRDQAAFTERQGDAEADRVGRAESARMRQRANEFDRAEQQKRMRAERAAAAKRLRDLRDAAFGDATLFGEGGDAERLLAGSVPSAPADVSVPACRGLKVDLLQRSLVNLCAGRILLRRFLVHRATRTART